jgi:8-oxo-dGTP pyrophosphatase MutT (NUDIX family)
MENFEICIRAIIQDKGKILVCFLKKEGIYFFPGGHLEFGESIPDALFREIKEELGIKIKKFSLIGLVDNFYEEEGKKHHEINLVFSCYPRKNSFRE